MFKREIVELKSIESVGMCVERVHPCILKNLIPVSSPIFIGLDGEEKRVRLESVEGKTLSYRPNFEDESGFGNLPLMGICVKLALELEWNYIYEIVFDFDTYEEKLFNIKVRGC